MNLRSWTKNGAAGGRAARLCRQPRLLLFFKRIFGQNAPMRLVSLVLPMSLSFARKAAICFCWGLFLVIPAAVFGQTNYYTTNGTEYAVAGSLPGDQVWPDAAAGTNGGFVVWQDNVTDGSGWGVSATRLDSTLSASPNWSDVRVNVQGTNDQENARVALLKNGGAVFVWQGGVEGFQHIYARFLTPTNTWLTTTDVVVSVPTNNFQINPAVAVLNNSNVVVVWASFDQAGSNSLQDVYAKILSPAGQTVSNEFLINQFTSYNQRTPVIAALAGGGFVVAWVSEQEQSAAPNWGTNSTYIASGAILVPSVDIYARRYNGNGAAQGGEFLVDTNTLNPCANPSVAAASDGSFMVAWGGRDMVNPTNGWDIYTRTFSSAGAGGTMALVNTHLPGNQYAPHISSVGGDYLVVWTSLRQDGSREGVYGQFVHAGGALVGGEFRVNTTTAGQQMHPALASDGVSQFLAVWTSYTGSPYRFDLFAQRYVNVATILPPMNAPIVIAPFALSNNVYQPQLKVSWATLLGISVSNFEVYVDGAATPAGVVTSNCWTMTAANGLTKNSTHSFAVDYVTTDARRSPMSPSASGSTWSGLNWGGIPYEWMEYYFGGDVSQWLSANSPVASGGPTLLQIFLTGGDPFDSSTWLQTSLTKTSQGMFLNWNTQPGLTYEVQAKTNMAQATWSNLGSPRYAAGTNDSIYVPAGYYQVLLQR
jgi:hypothetical protein